MLLLLRIPKLKGFQLQGDEAPWPHDQGLCPQTPVIGSRSPCPRLQTPVPDWGSEKWQPYKWPKLRNDVVAGVVHDHVRNNVR